MISVIIPTVDGREDHLERAFTAYNKSGCEVIVVYNKETCGEAWEEGARWSEGDFLHFTADDLEPHTGWIVAALETVREGNIPAPVVYNADGSLQTCGGTTAMVPDGVPTPRITTIPFMSRAQWEKVGPMGPMAKAHYYTDDWITYKAKKARIPVVIRHAYAFTHYSAMPRRGAGMSEAARMSYDRALFESCVS